MPLTDAEIKTQRSEQLQALQRVCFRMEGLQDFALSNLSAIDTAQALNGHFQRLGAEQLGEIAISLGLIHTAEQGATLGKPFLSKLLVSRCAPAAERPRRPCASPAARPAPCHPVLAVGLLRPCAA